MSPLKASAILFFSGAILGPVGDLCHLLTDTTSYPQQIYRFYFFNLIPFWVPLLFGSATLMIGLTHALCDAWFNVTQERFGTKHKVVGLLAPLFFLTVYGASGLIPRGVVLLGIIAFLFWFFLDRAPLGAIMALLTALAGTSVEIGLVSNGIFSYQPHVSGLFGVAPWLPWLYVMASVTVGNLGRLLYRI